MKSRPPMRSRYVTLTHPCNKIVSKFMRRSVLGYQSQTQVPCELIQDKWAELKMLQPIDCPNAVVIDSLIFYLVV